MPVFWSQKKRPGKRFLIPSKSHKSTADPLALPQENDISTRKLGKILGVDHSVAARILKGERAITVEHAKSLGARFKVDPKVFLEL